MRALLFSLALLASLQAFQAASGPNPKAVSADTLKRLSLEGEKLVDEEVRRALYGVKQMKEVMARNEEKHEHLMKSLRNSGEKKKGAAEMAEDVVKKLDEAEQHCKDSLKSAWEECRPCLEDTCKNFYTNSCRRGFATFSNKLTGFFRRVSARFGSRDSRDELEMNQSDGSPELDAVKIEESFSSLLTKVGNLVNRSMVLVSRFHRQLDQALRKAFVPELQEAEDSVALIPMPGDDLDSAYLQGVGLDDVLESFFDFGRSLTEEFSAVVTQAFGNVHSALEEAEKEREKQLFPVFFHKRKLCRDLRRQSAECWQLQNKCEACQGTLLAECPSVRELHVELDEVSELLEVSKQQYEEVLGIVQRHTEDTVGWLNNMAAEFDWVAELVHDNTTPENIFSITRVVTEEDANMPAAETKVGVNILNAPPLSLSVPAGLQLQDPAFIQYVAHEALGLYKQKSRQEDA
ncbi:clusterin-like protein 1 [Astyanax mexicanus]|uniref:Clusterin n=1 Tax=Astyanax mexicanus TaxID=7994 RepID=A0A8T2LR99_ASTMX|nr:clusterin-like protein 1 [Astyanax mexicanus]